MNAPKVTWSKDKADAVLAPYRVLLDAQTRWSGSDEDRLFRASLLLHSGRIPGMCPDDKINGLYGSMDSCPSGDVVEIGTWWGKSALVLLLLARHYSIGNILCVDPWRDEELVQGVPSVDEASAALSAKEAFEVFKMNLLPYKMIRRPMHSDDEAHDSDFNYFRATSAAANKWLAGNAYPGYPSIYSLISEEFGETYYSGRIALLHIDGNHAYEKVKQDVELWTPLVVPGGWIVIDDYDWRHGDGPRRAADEYLLAHPETMRHFIAGGAMFIQVPQ